MSKSFVMLLISLVMLMPTVLSIGCAKQQSKMDMDLYSKVPAAEHKNHFPHGHDQDKGSGGEKCFYSGTGDVFFCQFNWSE